MKTNKRGQSIIEYVLITILIVFGVIYMGPYVLRSISGHFNLWNDGIQDSFGEHLTQAPANSVPPMNSNCQCTSIPSGVCGGYAGSPCTATEEEVDYSCNPQGCNGLGYRCPTSNSCCSAAVDIGCGTIPTGQKAPVGNCNYGYHIESQTCGSNTTYQCIADNSCNAQCNNVFILYQGSTLFCSTGTSSPPTNGLTYSMNMNYVASHAKCPQGINCSAYCVPPYIFNGTSCALQFNVADAACDASPNHNYANCSCKGNCSVSKNNCAANQDSSCTDCACSTAGGSSACTGHSQSKCIVITNDESFLECANVDLQITSAQISGAGCSDPDAIPGNVCNISVTY